MISVITCSINPPICKKMTDSITATIGVPFELIVFDNREKHWGLCKVYNHCAKQAKYPYLCFVHEDIIMETPDWGKIMTDFAAQTPDCGVIGFAGGRRVQRFFSGWNGDEAVYVKERKKISGNIELLCKNPERVNWYKALTLDGLFLFCKYFVWQEHPFDEKTITGFHVYDADFTFSVSMHYQNYIHLGLISIFHASPGDINRNYWDSIFAFQKKWKHLTPKYLNKISFFRKTRDEYGKMAYTYCSYKKFDIPFKERCLRFVAVGGWWSIISFLPLFYSVRLLKKSKIFFTNK